jgi:hypothetical protein
MAVRSMWLRRRTKHALPFGCRSRRRTDCPRRAASDGRRRPILVSRKEEPGEEPADRRGQLLFGDQSGAARGSSPSVQFPRQTISRQLFACVELHLILRCSCPNGSLTAPRFIRALSTRSAMRRGRSARPRTPAGSPPRIYLDDVWAATLTPLRVSPRRAPPIGARSERCPMVATTCRLPRADLRCGRS